MSKALHFHNEYHLGDCLYQLHYQFRVWRSALQPSILYCNPDYHGELSHFIPTGYDVRLARPEDRPSDSVDSWIGAEGFYFNHPLRRDYHNFYVEWFQALSKRVGVESPIRMADDMLLDCAPILYRRIPPTHYDFLVINAQPRSQQWDHRESQFTDLVTRLCNARKSVITTHPCGLHRVPSTVDLGYRLIDIAKLSTRVQNIIAIDTGPIVGTFNVWNRTTVKHRFILHNTNFFTHAGCHAIHRWEELMPALGTTGCLNPTTS